MDAENMKKGVPSPPPYLTAVGAWALAFGCSVGWGSFVMPGTTFLPIAGPAGTAIGLGVGALVMLIIGMNFHYLMNRYPEAGGTYTYTKNSFGYDHGFLSAWFLVLTYIAIIWANATALPLIARTLLGSTFQVGFDYEVAGFHVYFGEILLVGDPDDPDNRKIYITEDTGSAVKGHHIDCFVETLEEVYSFETRYDSVWRVTYIDISMTEEERKSIYDSINSYI